MYAIVKTGGKQYRVEEGQSLLVERLPVDGGGKASLTPLLVVDGSNVVDGSDLAKVSVEARVVAHERGPKLRVVKFKPKRGYKRRTGHRQELTRIEVTSIKLGSRRASGGGAGRRTPKPVAASEGVEPEQPSVVAAESAPTAVEPEAAAVESAPTEARPKRARAEAKPGEGEAAPEGAQAEAEAKPAEAEAEAEAKPKRARRPPAKPKTEDENGS
jgi:large subunit ribosomal protein L21